LIFYKMMVETWVLITRIWNWAMNFGTMFGYLALVTKITAYTD